MDGAPSVVTETKFFKLMVLSGPPKNSLSQNECLDPGFGLLLVTKPAFLQKLCLLRKAHANYKLRDACAVD